MNKIDVIKKTSVMLITISMSLLSFNASAGAEICTKCGGTGVVTTISGG